MDRRTHGGREGKKEGKVDRKVMQRATADEYRHVRESTYKKKRRKEEEEEEESIKAEGFVVWPRVKTTSDAVFNSLK